MSLEFACIVHLFSAYRQERVVESGVHPGFPQIALTVFRRSCILAPFKFVAGVAELQDLLFQFSRSLLEQIIALVRPGTLQSGL